MASRIEDYVTAIEARYADTTVAFRFGKLALNEHDQQRSILFVRASGILTFTSAPGATAFGIPVGGQGTVTVQRFKREETLDVTLRAEDEEALDAMFDRFVNTLFEVSGPNVFDPITPYTWYGEDSKDAGDWSRRNPAIKLAVIARLASRSQPAPYAVLAAAKGTVTELGESTIVTTPAP